MAESSAEADPFISLPIPPLDSSIFSDDFTLRDDFFSFDDGDFDITLDDFHLPSDTEDFLKSTFSDSNPLNCSSSVPDFNYVVSNPDTVATGSDVSEFLNVSSSGDPDEGRVQEVPRVLNRPSPESRNDNPVSSQGSQNCRSAGSDVALNSMNCPSPDSGNSFVDQNQKVKQELGSNFVLKRKKDNGDANLESRTIKYQRSIGMSSVTENSNKLNENDEKKKARLIRNRESAQLSRQRKKHYVEDLEDKVRAMHSTIQDLTARISYFAAENATLRQQMVAGSAGCPPPVMYPPHPSMAPIGYPWMPCPAYAVKPQSSKIPLVPIPKLKLQQQHGSSKKAKKVDVKKSEGKPKTKKVASVSFLGLFLFIFLFVGSVPMVNVKFGEPNGNRLNDEQHSHHGRVLMGDNNVNGSKHKIGIAHGRAHEQNASEPLVASLYVPRNDKLVKIDGNLIIHSVLASEKAMASRKEQGMMTKKEETGLVPAISIPTIGRNDGRQRQIYRTLSERQKNLASDKENLKTKTVDGKLQQWFREGLAGPMLSSGMCTEVFQFDVSKAPASGAIVPATSVGRNTTYITKGKNRRILKGLPTPFHSSTNITKEHISTPQKNGSVSSMVVSVLVDPRDDKGVMGRPKSIPRIYVVVLLDSIKYVTYSCMLPFKGASGHLVTT